MQKKETKHLFSPSLFWDSNIDDIDIDKHAKFIVERVIKRGSIKDWETTLNFYGKETVRDLALSIRSLDAKSLNFLSICLNTDKKEFRCYN